MEFKGLKPVQALSPSLFLCASALNDPPIHLCDFVTLWLKNMKPIVITAKMKNLR